MNKKDSEYLTVTEIANKAGVTRNKAWSTIRKNAIEPINKNEKPFKFDSKIVLKLFEKQNKKQNKNKVNSNSYAVSDSVLEMFQKQIEIKDTQIEKLNSTIAYLKSENIALRVEGSKQRKLLEEAQRKKDAVSDSTDEEKVQKKHHFWHFWKK